MPRGTETITVLGTVAEVDRDWQGDPLPGAETVEDRDLRGCMVGSVATSDRPDLVLDAKFVFVPVGNIPPDAHDTLFYEAAEWSIDGAIAVDRKPKGKLIGWHFSMRRAT